MTDEQTKSYENYWQNKCGTNRQWYRWWWQTALNRSRSNGTACQRRFPSVNSCDHHSRRLRRLWRQWRTVGRSFWRCPAPCRTATGPRCWSSCFPRSTASARSSAPSTSSALRFACIVPARLIAPAPGHVKPPLLHVLLALLTVEAGGYSEHVPPQLRLREIASLNFFWSTPCTKCIRGVHAIFVLGKHIPYSTHRHPVFLRCSTPRQLHEHSTYDVTGSVRPNGTRQYQFWRYDDSDDERVIRLNSWLGWEGRIQTDL